MGKPKPKVRRRKRSSSEELESDSSDNGRRYAPPTSSKGANVSSKISNNKRQKYDRRELCLVVAEDEVDDQKPITWKDMTLTITDRPRRRFCTVCGFAATYKCSKCYKAKPSVHRHFCSVECLVIHDGAGECGKAKNLLKS